MKHKLILRPEAEEDLEEAYSWYESKRSGLGHDFLLHVEAGFRFIEKNPAIFPETYKSTRKYLIKRFPYKLIYLFEDERIIVLAVMHGRRKPNLIRKRLGK